METVMWTFKTRNFTVEWAISPCEYLDLSWDDDGDVRDHLDAGLWEAFDSVVRVYYRGHEIGADYLGQSIYENPADFRDHIGMNDKGHGSYFSDMVRGAVAEARKALADSPRLRAVA